MTTIVYVVIVLITISAIRMEENDYDIKILTVASDPTEGYNRFIRSAKHYKIDVETLGMGAEWLGGNMKHQGGGYKVNLLKKAIQPLKDTKTIILFTDSYDVVYTASLDTIVKKFKNTGANVLFGAEPYCWPDETVDHLYPSVGYTQSRFLNSGMFIGYASDLYEILKTPIKNTDDDQLYYTRAFLNKELREKLKFKLDYKSELFQNLHGSIGQVKLEFDEDSGESYITNLESETRPAIIHGNGPSKVQLNNFGNYLAGSFVFSRCVACEESVIELGEDNQLPTVTLALFIEKPVPFLEEYFDLIWALDYPKNKVDLFIHNAAEYHSDVVNAFVEKTSSHYASVKTILPTDEIGEHDARDLAVNHAKNKKTDYLFVVDAEAHLDSPNTLKELMKQNRLIISPTMVRPGEVWSNFWGALSEKGFYARSHDYMDIVKDNIRGVWNVPFISTCYLVKSAVLPKISYKQYEVLDAEMSFCKGLREQDIFLYSMNLKHYGHLMNGEHYNTVLARPDFYMLFDNRPDWEQRYIHKEYSAHLEPNVTFKQPCPDVYWFPIVTEKFCDDLVAIVENHGKWSDGSNSDERLQGGYEAVPTRDIHMTQVGLQSMYLKFLQLYVRPLQEAVFMGYYHNPPNSLMNFVVRYKPTEQPKLRPHHDSSTYTINIALNTAGVDYEGGGCRFLRYNCSVTDTEKGWMLMHPGRLTHFHEGLETTKGTRYIMISFVDP
ncbi:procollagen-lysine,2-oxoglutarate 5-dioxygenase isoform X2 [Bradysia coprophila]|uniref:procollagen-lysine,2-oxoglutarate 5-dioxygenase isoform X2 n=1 Tax=Bradysia coprophila TaxID=38358 RepID=UPI00187DC2C4|nr:procollagen-lysine,2-oxoglutarate 5-dioxygenase isoform X2 [Bradysia coprophila]